MRGPHDMKPGERYAELTAAGWCIDVMPIGLAEWMVRRRGLYRIPDDPATLPLGSRVVRLSDGVEGKVKGPSMIRFDDTGLWMHASAPGLLVALIELPEEDA